MASTLSWESLWSRSRLGSLVWCLLVVCSGKSRFELAFHSARVTEKVDQRNGSFLHFWQNTVFATSPPVAERPAGFHSRIRVHNFRMSRRAVQEAPCDARVADGAVRGTIVGALWAMYFWNNESGHVPRDIGALRSVAAFSKFMGISMSGFMIFFGAYNGVLCGAEQMWGADSIVGPVLAGGTMGSAIGAFQQPPRGQPRMYTIGAYSLFLAVVSAATASVLKVK